jgi:hypothetical protein
MSIPLLGAGHIVNESLVKFNMDTVKKLIWLVRVRRAHADMHRAMALCKNDGVRCAVNECKDGTLHERAVEAIWASINTEVAAAKAMGHEYETESWRRLRQFRGFGAISKMATAIGLGEYL